jgi:zinc/manganese transport system ATP-binding protein
MGHRLRVLGDAFDAHARGAVRRVLDGGYQPDVQPAAAMSPADKTIDVNNLWVGYGERLALEAVTVRFDPGTLTAVVGPNGAGKSSLLKAVAGVLRPLRGHITCAAVVSNRLAYLPQSSELDRQFPISVAELVTLGAWRGFGAFQQPADLVFPAVEAAMAATGLEGFDDRPIGDLSVGEFQRALFARVLLQNASVILLDEPFLAVDERTIEDLLRLVQRWQLEGRTVVAVLHDLDQVRAYFPAALLIARTVVACGASMTVLSQQNLVRARAALGVSTKTPVLV